MANYLNPSTEAKLLRVCDDEMLDKRWAERDGVVAYSTVLEFVAVSGSMKGGHPTCGFVVFGTCWVEFMVGT